MSYKILVVDDEASLVDTVKAYLQDSGFTVLTASNGRDALFINRHEKPDLIVLDLMMPEMDGWEAARLIRRESSVPIIMLTARMEDEDKVAALELGADDYVTKPFNPRELVARVRAVLRRTHGELAEEPRLLRVGDLELNLETYRALQRGKPLDLTPSEFDLLAALMSHPGRVFTRMELLDHIQGEAFAAYERTIDVHVKNLRAKLND
ncbi:MAG TPA: response regulator transcription factor, partial [Chloroflexi bacterium]|nr:response regulator transcription factor [Chloroflexota bacterium]